MLLAHVCCAEESYGLTENSGNFGGLDWSLTQVEPFVAWLSMASYACRLVGLLVQPVGSSIMCFL